MRIIAIVVGMLVSVASAGAATVATEYPDYAPGEAVLITGTDWLPGETVSILLQEDPPNCPDHMRLAIAGDDGSFSTSEFTTDEHDLGVTFTVTATGELSGSTAVTTFTDACASGSIADPTCPLTNLVGSC